MSLTSERDEIEISIAYIESFDQLFDLAQSDLLGYIKEARRLGMHAPTYEAA